MIEQKQIDDLLQTTSRTFALTVPLLAQPIRAEVGIAYLLFRIVDCFEDATHWTVDARIQALEQFIELMYNTDPAHSISMTARWLQRPPLTHRGYLDLLALTPRVLDWHRSLHPAAREHIREHLIRTARGMIRFLGRTNGDGELRLDTMRELSDYCFCVAGIVGQLLTELYLLNRPELASIGAELRERAPRFGEGLQLVNILKDAQSDATEGRIYLPLDTSQGELFRLTHGHLTCALEYTELLRSRGADSGIVTFNAMNARVALATLRVLQDGGLGSKLTRAQLAAVTLDVMRCVRTGAPLLPDA
jgi:farnesyl-diphosphate farnesyltransferase